ncbi:MAG TPA: TonB-dependent receptor [Longimicrobium sp.]|nr:TonB-dependent receptor [Longimicrobium sp.]
MSYGRAARLRRACALALLACALPAAARADTPACEAGAPASASTRQEWPPPLDRPLAFSARDISLRDALDRLSAAARIRISYSAELLPLERRVCVPPDARTVGDVLAELLRETSVEAVVAGGDHVVLALRRGQVAAAEPQSEFSRVVPLDRVVVTGSASGGPQRTLPFVLDVVTAEQMEREGTAPLTRFLATAASGPWGWEQSPASMIARYGSIRGASSFGVSAPKVFIDGIEVANPLLVTQIAPEAVERIEVIRGPQGAALYGTDAISGVVNIVTRHEGTDSGAPPLRIRGSFGRAESEFAVDGALARELAVAWRAGTSVRSAGLDLGVGGIGDFLPDGASRYVLASGSARQVGAHSIATGILRFYDARAGASVNPLLAEAIGPSGDSLVAASGPRAQRMRQYTIGGTYKVAPDDRWTHTLTAGLDGDRLRVPDERTPVPFAAEGVWRGSAGGADRGTLRLSSVARLGGGGRAEVTLTLAAEHSTLRETADAPEVVPRPHQPDPVRSPALVSWMHSTGAVAYATAALRDRVHVTAGLRVERNDGLAEDGYAALPVLGGVWLTEVGGASLKVRAAYGSGTRPPRTPSRAAAWGGAALMYARELAPERQSGLEAGFDLAYGGAFALQVTAYDQLASGIIQRVALAVDTVGGRRVTPYALQSVGQISNRGWEMQGTARLGRLSLEGAAAGVRSRVRRISSGYGGELRSGDRMLEVPLVTLSGTATWTAPRGTVSLTAYRAFDWINYDRLALARDFQSRSRAVELMAGSELRGYWRRYDGVPRMSTTVTLDLPRGAALVLSGDNLLDRQQGEPDNLTIVPGRTLMVGFRAAF